MGFGDTASTAVTTTVCSVLLLLWVINMKGVHANKLTCYFEVSVHYVLYDNPDYDYLLTDRAKLTISESFWTERVSTVATSNIFTSLHLTHVRGIHWPWKPS